MSVKKRRVSSTFGKMQKQEYLYRGPNHAANLNDMRLKDKYCDVTIKVNGSEIRAHKVILAANLNYFETMFSSGSFQESQGGVITMKSVEKAKLELFVSYAYTGEILLTNNNALNLLELANYLSEDGIEGACIQFLEKHLKVEEACRAYKFATTIDCLSLKNTAKAKIIANFGDCSKSADYLNFEPESLMDILSGGRALSVEMLKILFEGIIRWVRHSTKERKMCLEDLLSSIDVTQMTADDLVSCLYKNTVHHHDECGITKDTIMYYKVKQKEQKERVKVLMAMDCDHYQFYNFIEKKWTPPLKLPDLSDGFIYWPGAVVNDKLYYICQISGEIHLQVFDVSAKKSTKLYSTSSILEFATLCVCNQFLYICGGLTEDDSASDQVLRYDPQTNSLETLASMGIERRRAASIFYQGNLYVLGGSDDSLVLQSVEKYDPVKNEWTAVASMCEKRSWHAVAELNGKLYACGGLSGSYYESSVEVYDPTTNSWQLVARMNKARRYFLVVAYEGKLLAIGGKGEKTIEVYDPSEDQWQLNDEMTAGLQVDCRVGGLFSSSYILDTQ